MQQDVRTLAAKAASIEEGLRQSFPDGVVPITSQKMYTSSEHREGVTIEVPFGVAARHIAKGSHRVSTPNEHDAFRRDMEHRNEEYQRQQWEKRMQSAPMIAVDSDGRVQTISSPLQMKAAPPRPKAADSPLKENK